MTMFERKSRPVAGKAAISPRDAEEVLLWAAARIAVESDWAPPGDGCDGRIALDADGDPVEADSPEARRWSLDSALYWATRALGLRAVDCLAAYYAVLAGAPNVEVIGLTVGMLRMARVEIVWPELLRAAQNENGRTVAVDLLLEAAALARTEREARLAEEAREAA